MSEYRLKRLHFESINRVFDALTEIENYLKKKSEKFQTCQIIFFFFCEKKFI